MSTIAPTTAPAVATAVRMSAAEFARRHGGDRVELIDGLIQEMPMPFPKHGKICLRIGSRIFAYAEGRDCGHAMSNDSFVQTAQDPDRVRGADVSYYSYERLPKGAVPEGLLPVAPDLVVEVRSSELWTEVFTKVGEYLRAGVRVVVVLDPATATASVYRPDELQQIFDNGDELTIPDVLPGFSVPVRLLFE